MKQILLGCFFAIMCTSSFLEKNSDDIKLIKNLTNVKG